ncbi:hypothetical protein D7V80_23180 [Corallococcus sp. CA054B]|uniref:hypothetical protein n=1 Tax=Corallococcus sp. CA054B TaxID=2316734 RepID=UPI000EA216CB|nr:hypothetical protein [Corallococcus sp. CA054B]RKG65499.1 hypothetical protein D7V80_23180 [Corallococcus sp. CA054B]
MGYPNLGNFADMIHLDPDFDPQAQPRDGTAIDLFDFGNPYAPTSPEDELEQYFKWNLQRMLDQAGSM